MNAPQQYITKSHKQLHSTVYINMIISMQARSHWLGWSGFNLTTFYNFDLVNSVTLKTDLWTIL